MAGRDLHRTVTHSVFVAAGLGFLAAGGNAMADRRGAGSAVYGTCYGVTRPSRRDDHLSTRSRVPEPGVVDTVPRTMCNRLTDRAVDLWIVLGLGVVAYATLRIRGVGSVACAGTVVSIRGDRAAETLSKGSSRRLA